MAGNGNGSSKQFNGVETEDIARELAKRMKLNENDGVRFVSAVMVRSGYTVQSETYYVKPKQKEDKPDYKWFGSGGDDDDDDAGDDGF